MIDWPLATPAATIGCDSGDTTGYSVSGKVTYGGQPLPSGSIQFEPDATLGGKGSSASGEIHNGTYTTTTGGVSGGKYLVRITPPAVESGSDPASVVQFPTYEKKVDLPQSSSTQDFDIPKGP